MWTASSGTSWWRSGFRCTWWSIGGRTFWGDRETLDTTIGGPDGVVCEPGRRVCIGSRGLRATREASAGWDSGGGTGDCFGLRVDCVEYVAADGTRVPG